MAVSSLKANFHSIIPNVCGFDFGEWYNYISINDDLVQTSSYSNIEIAPGNKTVLKYLVLHFRSKNVNIMSYIYNKFNVQYHSEYFEIILVLLNYTYEHNLDHFTIRT